MSKHLEVKHEVQKKKRAEFNELIEEAMLSEIEQSLMKMYYCEHKDLGYIADTLGYSKAGIVKMHRRILKRLESLL